MEKVGEKGEALKVGEEATSHLTPLYAPDFTKKNITKSKNFAPFNPIVF